MPPVCVDASLVLMLLLPDEHSDRAESLFYRWAQENTPLVGPPLLYAEVPSVLRAAVFFNRITPDEGEVAFESFCGLSIAVAAGAGLHRIAWNLAKTYSRPRIYDSMYLAAAQAEGCELWTGDLRLTNAVDRPWVRWVGEEEA
jgi:predicted nucleic acid-binding protein